MHGVDDDLVGHGETCQRTWCCGYSKAWPARVERDKNTHCFDLITRHEGKGPVSILGVLTLSSLGPRNPDTYLAPPLLVQEFSDRIGCWVSIAFILLTASGEDRVWNYSCDFTALRVGDGAGDDAHDAALAASIYEGSVCCYEGVCYGCVGKRRQAC